MSPKKVLLLGVLILVPVLAYLFLKVFGTNHYALPRYLPEVTDTGDALVRNGDTVFHQVPDFRLTSQTGATVTQQDLAGKVYVANFFFASCTDVCKKMSANLLEVQEAFKNEPRVRIVSYTVDPDRDTVSVLNAYAATYGANAEQWYFLTGPRPQIYELAREGYKVPAMQAPSLIPDFIHSEKLMLVDEEKHVRGIYDGTSPEEVDRLVTEIKVLLHETDKNGK
jgi:protein SCO1/2